MKKIIITGGAGFIGQSLSSQLITLGYKVTILDNLDVQIHGDNPLYTPPKDCIFRRIDLRNSNDSLISYFEGIDIVIHLASSTGTGQSMYEITDYVKNNDLSTANILDALRKVKIKPSLFILASSRSVYGEGLYYSNLLKQIITPDSRNISDLNSHKWGHYLNKEELISIPTSENAELKPVSIYAANKITQEMLVRIACESMNIKYGILRLQNVYGPGQSLQNPYTGIISIFYNRIRQGLPIELFEDGNPVRDFIYIDDVVNSITKLFEININKGIILNIGTGIPLKISDISSHLYNLSKIKKNIVRKFRYRVGDVRSCYANIDNAKKLLDFKSNISIQDGLGKFIQWANTQPIYECNQEKEMLELKKLG